MSRPRHFRVLKNEKWQTNHEPTSCSCLANASRITRLSTSNSAPSQGFEMHVPSNAQTVCMSSPVDGSRCSRMGRSRRPQNRPSCLSSLISRGALTTCCLEHRRQGANNGLVPSTEEARLQLRRLENRRAAKGPVSWPSGRPSRPAALYWSTAFSFDIREKKFRRSHPSHAPGPKRRTRTWPSRNP